MEKINEFLSTTKKPALIRKFFLTERAKISLVERESHFQKIISQFFMLKEYQDAINVLAYYGKTDSGEFNTLPLIDRILLDGKRVFLPKCISEGVGLNLFEIKNSKEDVEEGKYGIMEPISDPSKQATIQNIDIAVIPGSVFDIYGTRYGYGKGYYDNLLQKCEPLRPLKIAFALDFTITQIPLQTHRKDIPMDIIISETRLLRIDSKP